MSAVIDRPDGWERSAKKVQDYMDRLEREVTRLRGRVRELSLAGPEDGNVLVSGQLPGDPDQIIGKNVQISFLMGHPSHGRDLIYVRHDRQNDERDTLRLECDGGRIVILPSASNSFRVRFED